MTSKTDLDNTDRDMAASFALGCLTEEEKQSFQPRIDEGIRQEIQGYQDVMTFLGDLAGQTDPTPGLKKRLVSAIRENDLDEKAKQSPVQVWKEWEDSSSDLPVMTVKDRPTDWVPTSYKGIAVKKLFVDKKQDRVTMLVRMDPGSAYPAHTHDDPEECYVLEGDLHGDSFSMEKGDFQRADKGSIHGVQYTTKGCVLFISSGLHDELLIG